MADQFTTEQEVKQRLYEQYQRFAAHHNQQETDKYKLAVANWRLNAANEISLGLPVSVKPLPGTGWAAAWQEPRATTQPILIENAGPVCPEESDNLPGQNQSPAPTGLVIVIGEPMTTDYHAGPHDTAPDGYIHREGGRVWRKTRSIGGFGVTQYWTLITGG